MTDHKWTCGEEQVLAYTKAVKESNIFDPDHIRTKLHSILYTAEFLGHVELSREVENLLNQFNKEQDELLQAIVDCPDMEG